MKDRNFIFYLSFTFVSLLLIVSFDFVHAQDSSVKIKEDNLPKIGEKSNELLEREIQIPKNLQPLTKVFFGINNEGEITFNILIILLALLIIFLALVKEIFDVFFAGGWKSWAFAILTTLLVSLSGGLLFTAGWILSISYFFETLEKYSVVSIAISLVFVAGLFYLLSIFISYMKSSTGKEKMRIAGNEIKIVKAAGEARRKAFTEREDNVEMGE